VLYLRELGEKTKQDPGNLEALISDLKSLDSIANEGHYGLSSLIGPEYRMGEEPNLLVLEEMEMVDYRPSNPHATLTDFGRALASLLRFPKELEDHASELFGCDPD
jgi:hypothetical protein